MKDKLWFFGAYNRTSRTDDRTVIGVLTAPGSPSVGTVIPLDTTRDLFAGKLTWSLSPNHTITGSVFGDPGQRVGPIFNAVSGPESTWNGTQKVGSTDFVGRYDGTFGNSFLVRAMYGLHKEKTTQDGAGKTIAQLINQTVTPNTTSNGWGYFQDQNVQSRRGEGRPHQVRGRARVQVRRRLRADEHQQRELPGWRGPAHLQAARPARSTTATGTT